MTSEEKSPFSSFMLRTMSCDDGVSCLFLWLWATKYVCAKDGRMGRRMEHGFLVTSLVIGPLISDFLFWWDDEISLSFKILFWIEPSVKHCQKAFWLLKLWRRKYMLWQVLNNNVVEEDRDWEWGESRKAKVKIGVPRALKQRVMGMSKENKSGLGRDRHYWRDYCNKGGRLLPYRCCSDHGVSKRPHNQVERNLLL